jgi:hypothetical protein
MGKRTTPDHFNIEEESGSKYMPFSSHKHKSKAKMRRNRKKVDADGSLDIAHHYLFSYLANKKSDADGSLDDDFDNAVITYMAIQQNRI